MKEINFAKTILQDRPWQEVSSGEVLQSSKALLSEWMAGEKRLERPKLYDHYALLLVALVDRVERLEEELQSLKNKT
ncbi:hypothetical protein [Deinococcus cellulosilyticus]|uniref:Peptidase S74 domain-containing protein n=1 Tax=Deinococcus cellulosilyticus (strain DSM 18568 / NBRC 106333 / KACC 11606 / 5516J-15) TaxID=1223518 RepID=A0A511N8T5_DEIC1|nr:hypothetical protein [Deinococcus cellulosilyticus]GEM49222.1 hypothetical protein DC3_48570 [Deinococcus cellulosilyticus NBRC 106333 = KACC 11606]